MSSLRRNAAVLDGPNVGRVLSGDMVRDIIGSFYNYSLTINTKNLRAEDYDLLYETLTAPVDSHIVTFPYGQHTLTFKAYVTNAEDTLHRMTQGYNHWGGLTINFIAMSPQKRPG